GTKIRNCSDGFRVVALVLVPSFTHDWHILFNRSIGSRIDCQDPVVAFACYWNPYLALFTNTTTQRRPYTKNVGKGLGLRIGIHDPNIPPQRTKRTQRYRERWRQRIQVCPTNPTRTVSSPAQRCVQKLLETVGGLESSAAQAE
ncbi:unnamed protein product, partial [Ectocarpus sp. 8 AP-2014]